MQSIIQGAPPPLGGPILESVAPVKEISLDEEKMTDSGWSEDDGMLHEPETSKQDRAISKVKEWFEQKMRIHA